MMIFLALDAYRFCCFPLLARNTHTHPISGYHHEGGIVIGMIFLILVVAVFALLAPFLIDLDLTHGRGCEGTRVRHNDIGLLKRESTAKGVLRDGSITFGVLLALGSFIPHRRVARANRTE